MGIEGLLGLLKPITKKMHISEFDGKTAAIDASSWLYKGAYSCAWELGTGQNTYGYLSYPLKMIKMLQANNIKPILVFDGLPIPIKEKTAAKRKTDRKANKTLALQYLKDGKNDDAATYFARAMYVRRFMVTLFSDVLEKDQVQYVVAPYEADAQLAYLCKEKIADFAISEDSDLLVYGCENIVFKLELDGSCENITIESTLRNAEFMKDVKDQAVKDLSLLSKEKFIEFAIASGCDYLTNIKGFGIKTALKFLKEFTLSETIDKIKYKKQFQGKIPDKYLETVEDIKLQFMHGKVIDTRTYIMKEFTPLTKHVSQSVADTLGKNIDPAIIEDYAKCLYSVKKKEKRARRTNEEIDELLAQMRATNREKYFTDNRVKKSALSPEAELTLKEIGKQIAVSYWQKKEGNKGSESEPAPKLEIEEDTKGDCKQLNDIVQKELDGLSKLQEEEKEPITSSSKEYNKPNDKEKIETKQNPFATRTINNKPAEESPIGKRNTCCLFAGDSLADLFKSQAKKAKVDTKQDS